MPTRRDADQAEALVPSRLLALAGPRSEPPARRPDPRLARPDDDRMAADQVTELVGRAKNGESDAFGELYDRYVRQVFRYVSFRVSSRTAAEDIVSETFLRAWRRIDSFNWQGRDIGAWFTTIARNLIIDDAKSSRSRLELPMDDLTAATLGGTTDGPEEAVLSGLDVRAVRDALRGLRPEQRDCLVLRFLEGLSVRETALAMGKNEGAVKALQLRAVRSLARSIPRSVVC